MFVVKAGDSINFVLDVRRKKAFDFFSDPENYNHLMPNVSDIHQRVKEKYVWKIFAKVPVIGSYEQEFVVRQAEMSEDLIEWIPEEGEKENFLRVTIELEEIESDMTAIKFSLVTELQRRSAMGLHMLAGLAGDKLIGEEMTREISTMIEVFAENVKNEFSA